MQGTRNIWASGPLPCFIFLVLKNKFQKHIKNYTKSTTRPLRWTKCSVLKSFQIACHRSAIGPPNSLTPVEASAWGASRFLRYPLICIGQSALWTCQTKQCYHHVHIAEQRIKYFDDKGIFPTIFLNREPCNDHVLQMPKATLHFTMSAGWKNAQSISEYRLYTSSGIISLMPSLPK